jgi:hypothetical protein
MPRFNFAHYRPSGATAARKGRTGASARQTVKPAAKPSKAAAPTKAVAKSRFAHLAGTEWPAEGVANIAAAKPAAKLSPRAAAVETLRAAREGAPVTAKPVTNRFAGALATLRAARKDKPAAKLPPELAAAQARLIAHQNSRKGR